MSEHPSFKKFPSGDRGDVRGLPSQLKYHGADTYTSSFKFVGLFNQAQLARKATEYIVSRSDSNRPAILSEMERFLSTAARDCKKIAAPANGFDATQMCWFSIRIESSDKSHKMPKWHKDGVMFPRDVKLEIPQFKYALTLLGPSTRVLLSTPEQDEVYDKANRTIRAENKELVKKADGGDDEAMTNWWKIKKPFMAERLQGLEEEKLEPCQIIRWACGDGSPVHSDPDCTYTDRIFVSMFFGTKNEMENNYIGEKIGEEIVDVKENLGPK